MTPESQERIPYIGPLPFLRRHRDLFFGRDNEVSELLSLVISHRVLLLYAQSGAGKTSLLNAGLVPVLEEEGFEVLPLARVTGLIPKGIEPGEIPNLYAFNTLMSWSQQEQADPRKLLEKSPADFLRQRERPSDEEGRDQPRVVIFDQFEELFSAYQQRWTERKEFFDGVVDMLEDDPLLRVIFAIREDYIAQLDPYAHLLPERLRTRYRLERLRAEAACQAVERPLRDTGRTFARGVALRLVNKLLSIRVEDAAGEIVETPGQYVEPVQLQIVCQSLWRNLPEEVTVIVDGHLEKFGDVQEVLRGFYERAIDTAKQQTPVRESSLRHWFNDKLITPAGTRGTVFQGKEQTEGIANSAVEVLEAQHIIRAERRAGARWYELTHDRLIEPIRRSNGEAQARRFRRRAAALFAICTIVAIISTGLFLKYFNTYTYSLTLEAAVGGSVVKDPNKVSYKGGERVTLKPEPDDGYIFGSWSGALSDSNSPATLVMDGDKQVTANFSLKTYILESGAVDGFVKQYPDTDVYEHGTTVNLEAVPNPGYSFTHWSGDLSDSDNPTKLVMNADKLVSANFGLQPGSVTTNSIGMKLVYIPTGSFMMGSGDPAAQLEKEYNEEEGKFACEVPQGQVRISKGFWIGRTEVTQDQYKRVINAQPWSEKPGVRKDPNRPAVYVSWNDAGEFCRMLSILEGETYRLPTEAEWEYACRAGTTTRFSFGNDVSPLSDYAWFKDKTKNKAPDYAQPVQRKAPNNWGLYDMHGNVWEWCSDYYDENYYSDRPAIDPENTALSVGANRSRRGGSWKSSESKMRPSVRSGLNPNDPSELGEMGFRVVREFKTTYSLIANAVGGSVTKSPDKAGYSPGETVTLRAVPNKGYRFASWLGDLAVSTNQVDIKMDSDKSVTANFVALKKEGDVVTNSIGMKLVYIPAGSFMMGSGDSAAQLARDYGEYEEDFADEFPKHQVRISKGFWIGQTEVTQGQYMSVMNDRPWSGKRRVQEDANNPAVYVCWEDALVFCMSLSQREGKTYRLPTEAQWEYACRAGTTTRFSFGNSGSSLGDYAWFDGNADAVGQGYAHPVGRKTPNPWGLYDMHGNVLEWCNDWYAENYYSNSAPVDPNGPQSGTEHSLRGGCWYSDEYTLRCSYRHHYLPPIRNGYTGFRVVREPKTFSLTATAVGGSVTKDPDKTGYDKDETVTLTAVPNKGYFFTNWSGDLPEDLPGDANRVTIKVDSDKSVTANFTPSDKPEPNAGVITHTGWIHKGCVAFGDREDVVSKGHITLVKVCHGGYIFGLQVYYGGWGGGWHGLTPAAGFGLTVGEWAVPPGEWIESVEGQIEKYYISRIRFITNKKKSSPWFGGRQGAPFAAGKNGLPLRTISGWVNLRRHPSLNRAIASMTFHFGAPQKL